MPVSHRHISHRKSSSRAAPVQPGVFPNKNHDHRMCVKTALIQAQEMCTERGVRSMLIRQKVFELIWPPIVELEGTWACCRRLHSRKKTP